MAKTTTLAVVGLVSDIAKINAILPEGIDWVAVHTDVPWAFRLGAVNLVLYVFSRDTVCSTQCRSLFSWLHDNTSATEYVVLADAGVGDPLFPELSDVSKLRLADLPAFFARL